MNILWQNEHYPDVIKGGGGAVNTHYIVKSLRELGHRAVILARPVNTDGLACQPGSDIDTLRLAPPSMPPRLWPFWPLLESRYLRSQLANIPAFDAFVCIDAAYALSLKRLHARRPLLYRVEGLQKSHDRAVPRTPEDGAAESGEFKLRVLRNVMVKQGELLERLAWWRSDALIVKSRFMRREFHALYGVSLERIHVIPNGVDFERYATAIGTQEMISRLRGAAGDRVVISFTGRLVRMKNVAHLLRAFSGMAWRDRCVLVIMGDGDQRETLEREAARLGIGKQVMFLGHVTKPETVLAVSDIFVLPSTYEPFGNALLEAMAAGIPCVALRPNFSTVRTASSEILSDGRTGFLVDGADARELGDVLDRLVDEPALRREVGRSGQAVCRARYSWITCARQYVALARDVANSDGRRETGPGGHEPPGGVVGGR